MTMINRLSSVDSLQSSDQLPIWATNNGDGRKVSIKTLLEYMQSALEFPQAEGYTTQRAAPSTTGFDINITDGSADIHLILTPAAGYATGAITLPAVGNAVDGQLVLVNCTQAVTSFTVNANGATSVSGEPSSLSADDFFKLKYDAGTSSWYRVG